MTKSIVKMRRDLPRRFWSKVKRGPACWLWTGTVLKGGYGKLGIERKHHLAHRVAWALSFGPVPDGMLVLHRCDVRRCVRPDHLFLGSQADNIHDMRSKGRGIQGTTHPQAKLRPADVPWIRAFRAMGFTQKTVGGAFGVSVDTIHQVDHGRHWTVAERA